MVKIYGKRRRLRSYMGKRRLFRRSKKFAKRLKRAEKQVKRIQSSIETKQWTVPTTSTQLQLADMTAALTPTVDFSSQCICLPAIAQGTGVNQRVGNKVRITSVTGNFEILGAPPTATEYYDGVRIMIICVKTWRQNPTFNLGDYLASAGTPNDSVTALYNWENRKNYRVLYDKHIMLNYFGSGASPTFKHLQFNVKVNRNVIYATSAATAAAVEHNNLFLVMWSNSSATPHPSLEGSIRVKYQDA